MPRRFLLALVISALGTLGVFYFTRGWEGIGNIKTIDPLFFALALISMFFVWSLDASVFWFLFKGIRNPVPFKDLFLFNMVGTLISNITPFYAGGPPAFIYLLNRKGVDVGKSALVLTTRMSITALMAILTLPFLLLIFGPRIFTEGVNPLTYSLPTIMIFSLIVFLFLFTRSSKDQNAYYKRCRTWPLKVFLKNDKFRRVFRWSLVQGKKLRTSARLLLSLGWKNLILAFIFTVLYWGAMLGVAPLILYSLKVNDLLLVQTFTGQLALNILLAFSPTPGGSGAAELGAASLFLKMVPPTLLALFTLLWRILTYHLTIIAGLFALIAVWRRVKIYSGVLSKPEATSSNSL
ncbi:MAG: flippase-like domain-containing protein [Caldiserica bacterium]|nr:flippase-like domain-containing protein [Caldisericota bacterium]